MIFKFRVHPGIVTTNSKEVVKGFVCLFNMEAKFLGLGEVAMAAVVGNFLFVSNIGNQAALPSVL